MEVKGYFLNPIHKQAHYGIRPIPEHLRKIKNLRNAVQVLIRVCGDDFAWINVDKSDIKG